jgi:hypothetical protein
MRKLILFLMRKKLRVEKYEYFKFSNQKSKTIYFFDDWGFWRRDLTSGKVRECKACLNFLLSDECEIVRVER